MTGPAHPDGEPGGSGHRPPGVHVEEVPVGPGPVRAAGTSVAGLVGMTVRGPVGSPVTLTSRADFARTFGGHLDPTTATAGRDALPYAVQGFFENGGSSLVVVRVAGPGASEATATLHAEAADGVTTGLRRAAGAGRRVLRVTSAVARSIVPGTDVVVDDGDSSERGTVVRSRRRRLVLADPLVRSHPRGARLAAVSPVLVVHARGAGAWGHAVRVGVTRSETSRTTVAGPAGRGERTLALAATSGLHPGSELLVGGDRLTVETVDAPTGVGLTGALAEDVAAGTAVVEVEHTLHVERVEAGRVVEDELFEGLSLHPHHPRHAPAVLGRWEGADRQASAGLSSLVCLEDVAAGAHPVGSWVHGVPVHLEGGEDDVAGVDDGAYVGSSGPDPAHRAGIGALHDAPTVSLVAAPGRTSLAVQHALLEHCEVARHRFAVLETPLGATTREVEEHRRQLDSTHGAIYHPGLEVLDPFGSDGRRRRITGAGHVLGVIARTDTRRGVHVAPANELVLGVLGLDQPVDRATLDVLNRQGVSCLRDLRTAGRGVRVVGARVVTSHPEARYVSVRRLVLHVEQSVELGLQWVVHEANDERLWGAVERSVAGFLQAVWRSGALAGTRPSTAFYVRVGRGSTMTDVDVREGRLVVDVGVAPVRPATFTSVRVVLATREATP